VVFAPALGVTITVEHGGDQPDIHLHAGGQGFWIARLMSELGAQVTLVGPVGGEVGPVLAALVETAGIGLKRVEATTSNGAYVHDRRGGDRRVVAEMAPRPLSRHDADSLYGAALVAGLDADVCVLAGPGIEPVVDADLYRRLTVDLRANGVDVIADLSGESAAACLAGGVSILKTSDEELERDGFTGSRDPVAVHTWAAAQVAGSDRAVVVTRAESGALVVSGHDRFAVELPPLEEVEHRGAGDSFTAALSVGTARGLSLRDAVCLGAAAGALNVTRRGLGTGSREDIERLAARIGVRPVTEEGACAS
jgi:1-phosphofructokinase